VRRLGLSVPAWRAWERLLTLADRRHDPAIGHDDLPLPPGALRVRVIMTTDPEQFMTSGAIEKAQLAALAATHGLPMENVGRLLDFGCGCGRILRHWRAHFRLELHGSDNDPLLVDWVGRALPFVQAHRNGALPPLPYASASFGLVYAISVFTHLTRAEGERWMAELQRIVRPGGLLMFSVLPVANLDRLRPTERSAFDRGELVVQFAEASRTNLCVAYHPEPYLRELTRDFQLLGARLVGLQPVWVARRPSPQTATGD